MPAERTLGRPIGSAMVATRRLLVPAHGGGHRPHCEATTASLEPSQVMAEIVASDREAAVVQPTVSLDIRLKVHQNWRPECPQMLENTANRERPMQAESPRAQSPHRQHCTRGCWRDSGEATRRRSSEAVSYRLPAERRDKGETTTV